MILCSKQKDIYRVFQYHGAEHKTIFCYEAGLPLTVENVPHPAAPPSALRHELSVCGRRRVDSGLEPCLQLCQLAQHVGARGAAPAAAAVPVVGVTYEFNRCVGGHDNKR